MGDSSLESQVELTEEEKFQLCLIRLSTPTLEVLLTPRKSSTSESDGPPPAKRKPLKKPAKSDEPSDSTQSTKNDDDSKPPVPANLTEPPKN